MEYITIELRQRIQSCNVFILLLDKSSNNQQIQLHLKDTKILLNISNKNFIINLQNNKINKPY